MSSSESGIKNTLEIDKAEMEVNQNIQASQETITNLKLDNKTKIGIAKKSVNLGITEVDHRAALERTQLYLTYTERWIIKPFYRFVQAVLYRFFPQRMLNSLLEFRGNQEMSENSIEATPQD